jgi:hypothetical protein
MMLRRLATVVALLLTLVSAPVWAAPQDQEGAEPGPVLSSQEVQRLLDAYVVLQAQDALKLSDAQYPQFLTKLRPFQEVRRRNEQSRLRLMTELNRLTNGRVAAEGAEAQVRERLKALDDLEVSSASELRRAREELFQTLDFRQQARFRVFEEQMERRKLELLLRARARPRPQRP